MAAPNPSRLDANQVLQGSFDENRGRLRVDSESTVVNADIDVALDATEDNVAIADPEGDFLEIEADGSINVNSVNGALEATQQLVLNELRARLTSIISVGNSTSTSLIAGAEFTGDWTECLGYSNISVTTNSDVASATDGIIIEWSTDGINIDNTDTYTTTSPFEDALSFGIITRYFRIRYINGPSTQTFFRLQTILHTFRPKPSSHRIETPISGENDAELTKAVITGRREDGVFDNVDLSNSSSIKVAITDRPSEVMSRIHIEANIEAAAISSTPNIIHTVTPGFTFYMTSLILSAINEGNVIGRMVIRDGVSNKIPFVLPSQVTGAASPANVSSPPLPEPITFTTDVNVVGLTGTITASITIVGYEEPN